jgi:dolichyl-phosphate-mannose-protein mannosyltransferase
VNPGSPSGRKELAPAFILAGLIVLALVLRTWRLGAWGFEATEMFTLRDSNSPQFSNPRPIIYLLNYYLVRPFRPLDEFGLRLFPALFGVLAIPTFYLVVRRLAGTRAALFGAFLLTLSSLHVYYSQFARYWSLVFLLAAVYPYAIYLGLREGNRRMLALGVVTGLAAILAHPISVLLLGGMGLWLLATYARREQLANLWSRRSVRGTALLLIVFAAAIVVHLIPVLRGWISMHDRNPNSGEFLLHLPGNRGVKQIVILLSFVDSMTLPLFLAGVLGIYLLWRERDRSLALLLAYLAIVPTTFLILLSLRAPISTYYLVPTMPVYFLGAGIFLDRLTELSTALRPRWLLPAAVVAIIIAAGAPTLVSQYRDGRRYDFRGVAHWLDQRLGAGDIVFSDQPLVLAHYLDALPVQRLSADTAPLSQSIHSLAQAGHEGNLWIVAPAPAHAFRTNPKMGSLEGWMYDNCQLRNNIGVSRLDYRQYYLQIYRCPPALSVSATSR